MLKRSFRHTIWDTAHLNTGWRLKVSSWLKGLDLNILECCRERNSCVKVIRIGLVGICLFELIIHDSNIGN
ncbi:hypothetical protein STSP1_01750 [Sedimentisphaera salicampi]|uniref:Uncharacterized protein n=1 Tax=Sedimentisphaera salicampi TaxID=1941349 RepID=A0A1W6LNM7_9BACT|nr:hypothetical protein STSP1_01750 [Sedimentisphaera salicampi]